MSFAHSWQSLTSAVHAHTPGHHGQFCCDSTTGLTCRTIFFWAPLAKWGLVAAGLKDLGRPAEKLSTSQNVALAATGFIWVRRGCHSP